MFLDLIGTACKTLIRSRQALEDAEVPWPSQIEDAVESEHKATN